MPPNEKQPTSVLSRWLRLAVGWLMGMTVLAWCALASMPAVAVNLVQLSPTTWHTEHAMFIIADPTQVTFPSWSSVYSTANVNSYVAQLKAAFPDDYMMVVVAANQLTPNQVPSVITARSLASGIGQNGITGVGVPNIVRYNLGGGSVFTPTFSVLDHEVGHNWGVQIGQVLGIGHWHDYTTVHGQMADSYTDDGYVTVKQIFGDPVNGFTWSAINNLTRNETETFADQDLYAMGLHPIFPDTYLLTNPVYNPNNTVSYSAVTKYDHAWAVANNGPRSPSYQSSPKQFRFGFVYVARNFAEIQSVYAPIEQSIMHFESAEQIDAAGYRFQVPFLVNTKYRASINARLADLDGNTTPTLTLGAGYMLSNDGNATLAYQAGDADGPAPSVSFVGSSPNAVIGGGNITLQGLTAGTHFFTVKAQDAGGKKAFAHFVVDVVFVNSAPAITSTNNAAFTVLNPGTFSVTASGYPSPTFSVIGALPAGVTLSGGGVLAGTPATGTAGNYPISVVASNGVGSNAVQNFILTVARLAQAISFGALASKLTTDAPFMVSATGGVSGNLVTFTSLTAGVCQVSGTVVSILGVGSCTIAADQVGSADYLPAPQVTSSFSITVPPPVAYTVTSSAGSNGSITPSGSQSVNQGSTLMFSVVPNVGYTPSVGGTCGGILAGSIYTTNPITANCTVTASFAAGLLSQVISFGAVGNVALGSSPFIITASGGASGNPVVFTSSTPLVCSVTGSTVTVMSAGTCAIVSNQAGNAMYAAASAVTQSFIVIVPTPSPPRNLACVAGLGQNVCSFDPPQNSGSSVVTGYTLTCIRLINSVTSTVTGGTSPLTLTDLLPGTAYLCSVTAINAHGTSGPSNSVIVTLTSATSRRGGIDSNGDGKAEVVVRNGDGSLFMGVLNAQNQLAFTPSIDPGPTHRVLGAGDFGGRGRSDLLLQEISTGLVKIWAGFDGPPDSEYPLRTVKAGWVVEAIADIDGDGKADIVWRYAVPGSPDSGVVFVWFMKGAQVDEIRYRGGAPLAWDLIGAVDLHGTGRNDMLWVSPANAIRSITALANRGYANELLGAVPAGYALVRAGDFSGDGKADLLFRNAAGKIRLWRMDGLTMQSEIDLPDTDPAWVFYAAGDMNGDGTMDIVFRKPDNGLVLWLMNKSTPQAPTVFSNAGVAPAGTFAIDP